MSFKCTIDAPAAELADIGFANTDATKKELPLPVFITFVEGPVYEVVLTIVFTLKKGKGKGVSKN